MSPPGAGVGVGSPGFGVGVGVVPGLGVGVGVGVGVAVGIYPPQQLADQMALGSFTGSATVDHNDAEQFASGEPSFGAQCPSSLQWYLPIV